MAKHVIRIHEHIPINPEPGRYCEVTVSIDKKHRDQVRRLDNQFSGNHPHWIGKYLEDGLRDPYFKSHHACVLYILDYQLALFNSLGIAEDIKGFENSDIEIKVFANTELYESKVSSRPRMSILEFYWELLEYIPDRRSTKLYRKEKGSQRISPDFVDVWPPNLSVSVCRVVPPKHLLSNRRLSTSAVAPNQPPRDQRDATGNRCRILLVIARHIRRFGEYEISPSFVKCALLKLFEELNLAIGWDFYQLEVVRPGSFKELGRHLARRDRYDIVHFDMHGVVRCQKPGCGKPRSSWQPQSRLYKDIYCFDKEHNGSVGRAFLIFARMEKSGKLSLSEHPASEVAILLRKHRVQCVALNACESARMNEGASGNLSYTFVRYGISNVVAMSFQISDVTFVKYFESFYRALFQSKQKPKSFLLAASHARRTLRKDPERADYSLTKIDMYDWFVPVTYSDENAGQLMLPLPETSLIKQESKASKEQRHLKTVQRITYTIFLIVGTAISLRWASIILRPRAQSGGIIWKAFRLFAETGISYLFCKLSRIVLRLRFSRYPAAKEIRSAILDINMLSIESELINKRSLVLHGLSNIPNTLSLVDNLAYVWDRTGFIELIVIIPSIWFYQPKFVRKIRHWCCSLGHRACCCHGESRSLHPHSRGRTVVIITDLELIFPQRSSVRLPWLQSWLLQSAQRRFVRYLAENFRDTRKKPTRAKTASIVSLKGRREEKPFLFLSGNANLEDEKTLRASLDRLRVIGLNSTEFREVQDYSSRTAIIEDSLNPDKLLS